MEKEDYRISLIAHDCFLFLGLARIGDLHFSRPRSTGAEQCHSAGVKTGAATDNKSILTQVHVTWQQQFVAHCPPQTARLRCRNSSRNQYPSTVLWQLLLAGSLAKQALCHLPAKRLTLE